MVEIIHIKVPRDGERRPDRLFEVPAIDTGGAWRPAHRPQNPNSDPKEPYGGESTATGNDHGWSNCTMAAGATAYAYESHADGGSSAPWGGDMRHNQDDLSGGTDLNDLKTAWKRFGNKTLTIKSGQGWQAVVDAHNAKRPIVIQGEGNVPGNGDFTGGHACCIGVETNSDGKWLWSDPDTTGWQWVTPSSIKEWAQRMSSSILFAVGKAQPTPPPEPEPAPPSGDVMNSFDAPKKYTTVFVETNAWLYYTSAMESHEKNIQINPGRDMPVVGTFDGGRIVSYVKSDGTNTGDAYWVKSAGMGAVKNPTPPGCPDCPDCPDCPECPDCPPPPDPLLDRQAQWDADATNLIGPRPE